MARHFRVYSYFYKKKFTFCFYIKALYLIPPSFLKLLKLLVRPWTDISINYIIDLPKCLHNGKIYKYIFIVINCLIKIRYFIPITSLDTKEFIKAFTRTVYKLYSTLSTIVFNKGFLFIFNL